MQLQDVALPAGFLYFGPANWKQTLLPVSLKIETPSQTENQLRGKSTFDANR